MRLPRRTLADALLALPAGAGVLHTFLVLALIGTNEVLWIAAAGPVACFLVGWRRAVPLSAILVLATLALGWLVSYTGIDAKLFYSPATELADFDFSSGTHRFRKNTELDMVLPYGDLNARLKNKIPAEPRKLFYKTDSPGFRNNAEPGGQQWAFIGDSFVAGLSNSQSETITALMGARPDREPYNLGYPGDVVDYAYRADLARERLGPEVRLAVFFYEGNDFEPTRDKLAGKPWPLVLAWKLKTWYRYTPLGRTAHYLSVSLKEKPDPEAVAVESLAGRPFAFLRDYVNASKRRTFTPDDCYRRAFARLAAHKPLVFFIPTKYRVYHRLMHPDAPPLLHANHQALLALCREHGLELADLTPALVREAARLLEKGEFVWWPDDTHWNPAGTLAAAGITAQRTRTKE